MQVVGSSNSLAQRGSGREKDIEFQFGKDKYCTNVLFMYSKRKNS